MKKSIDDIVHSEALNNQKVRKSGMRLPTKIVAIADAVILAGLVCAAANFDGVKNEIPNGATLSHYAAYTGILENVLARRNNIKDIDYIRAGDTIVLYHDGAKGFFEKIFDSGRDLYDKIVK